MKNTDRLEDFIRNNRDEFDIHEPSSGVWEKIREKNKRSGIIRLNSPLIRVAAVLAVALIFSAIFFSGLILLNNNVTKETDPELKELLETEHFYAQKVTIRLEEIRKCYSTFPEIKSEVEMDLNELETMYNSLKEDLKENISNKPVIEAMIENNRFRLKLVDSVLEQINC
jgi:hypothetical protein